MFTPYSLFLHLSLFFFNDTATTEIYTLSLHDALPIFLRQACSEAAAHTVWIPAITYTELHARGLARPRACQRMGGMVSAAGDRKSTRLNSSHANISYAVFCLKKKKTLYCDRRVSRGYH